MKKMFEGITRCLAPTTRALALLFAIGATTTRAEVLTYGSTGSSGDGYYISTDPASPTTVFTNLSIQDMITEYKMSGYIGGGSITEAQVDGVYNITLVKGFLTAHFQKVDGGYLKCVVVVFRQSGSDIVAHARSTCYKATLNGATLGDDISTQNVSTAIQADATSGYGIYGITLTTLGDGESPATVRPVAIKPLAIWNGDFPTSGVDERNGYTLSLADNVSSGSSIQMANSGGGVTVKTASSKIVPFGAVASFTGITGTGSRMLATGYYSDSSLNYTKVGLYNAANNFRVWNSSDGSAATDNSHNWNTAGMHYCGYAMDNKGENTGTTIFYDGVRCANASGQYTSYGFQGVNIGGQYNSNSYKTTGASVGYIAILKSSYTSDFAAWSLTEMTSSANFSDGGAISGATSYSATGINLNGGTVTLSGNVTAAAIFVQSTTTLSFANGATLTVGSDGFGPIYIAEGATLTIDATACSPAGNVAEDLVKGVFYGKSQVTVETPAAFGSALSDVGITIGKYLKWGYAGTGDEYTISSSGTTQWATLTGNSADSYIINVTETATLNIDTAPASELAAIVFNVAAGKTLTLTGSTLSAGMIIVTGGGSVSVSTHNALAGKIKGDGVLRYVGITSAIAGLTGLNSSTWTGTLWYRDIPSSFKLPLPFNDLGNANSTVRVDGVESSYISIDGNATTAINPTVDIGENGLKITDGNGGSVAVFGEGKLTGSGRLYLGNGSENGNGIVIRDTSGFAGKIEFQWETRHQVTFASTGGSSGKTGKIFVESGFTAVARDVWLTRSGTEVSGTLKLSGAGRVSGPLAMKAGGALDVQEMTGSGAAVSGTLTLASGTTIKLPAGATLPYQLATAGNGFIENVTIQIGNETATTGTVCLSGGAITTLESVDIDTEKTYTVAEVFGTPSATSSYEINVTSDATLDIDAAVTVDVIKFNIDEGKTLTISGSKLTAENVAVSGGGELVFAVSDTKTLARNAVAGAPYRVWLYKFSSLTGSGSVSIDESSVEVPTGYSYSVLNTSMGCALEFTTRRQFGSLNINFSGKAYYVDHADAHVSDNSAYSGLMHGASPVVGTSWNDVPAKNASDVVIAKYVRQDGSVASDGVATITLSGVANPWGVETVGDRILYGYCDDSSNPQVVINNIPFAKYRVIAYAATDTSSTTFCPKTINGVSYSTAGAGSTVTPTISGGTGNWGASDSRSTLAEGVNYLVSDVISGTTTVTINNVKGASGRACIAAVQIVEVGVANTFDIDAAGTYTPAGMFSSMSAGVAYEINVNESATLEIGSATTAGKVTFNVAAGKVLTLAGDGTLTAQTFVFDGAGKVATSDALRLSGILEGPGTFSVANVTYTNFRMVGESGKLIFSGISGFGYAVAGTTNNRDGGTLELVDNGDTKALTISNGYSGFRAVFDALVGTGTFKSSHATQHIYVFKNASEFAGTIDLATGAKTSVVLGDDTETTPADGSVLIPSDSSATVANGKTWNAAGGIDVSGTLKFAGTGATSANVALGADGTLDFSAYSGATPAIAGAVTLNGGAIRLPAGATLPYQIAASGDGAPSYYTIGEGAPQTGVLLKNGSLVATRTATISSAEPVVFGEIGWTGSGDDYTLTLSAPTYLTFDSTKVDSLKIIVENDVGLYVNGDMPENTTIIGLTPLTIASGLATYYVGYTRLYSQIGTTENGNGALNESGSIAVLTADGSSITAGNYTLARWLAPQIMGTGYGTVGTLTANVASGLSKELVYMTDRIVLRVYDATAQAARGTMRIMPFGDSITEGYNSGASLANYRAVLAQKLTLAGFNVEMAGVFDKIQTVNNSAGSMADAVDPSGTALPDAWKWHSAKHGATVGVTASTSRSAMIENVDTICSLAGPVDAILVLAGINDLAATGETVDTTFANWTSLVFRLCADRPEAKIIVSTMLGTDSRYSNSAALKTKSDALNALIKAQVAKVEGVDEGAFPAGRVVLADLNAYVTPGADGILSSDGLHPDWWGDDQMAQGWFDAIIDSGFMPDGTFASATIPAAPATADLGAAAKPELAGYISGFTRYAVLEADNGINLENIPYTHVNESAPSENLAKVGYFVEYVEKDHHSHKWVWVDMDAFGTTIGDVGLPTVNKQQTVTSLHVKSNHNAIDNVEAQDHTVEGWIEFSPFTYTVAPSGVTGAPAAHSGAFDWNDTLAESGAQGCMQVFRKAPPSGRAAQTLFAFNNWNQSETEAEFGIGNFAQHFSGNSYQTLDYTETKGLEKVNASAFTVKRIEIWTRSALPEPTFTYEATPSGGTPSGWIDAFVNHTTCTRQLIGPNADTTPVYMIKSGEYDPWASMSGREPPFSFAFYADLSQISAQNSALLSFGNPANGLVVYYIPVDNDDSSKSDSIRVGRMKNNSIEPSSWTYVPRQASGYHLYTVTCAADGTISVYVDDGAIYCVNSEKASTGAYNAGFQIGGIYDNNNLISWLSESCNDAAIAQMVGYNRVLSRDEVAFLSESFPATSGRYNWDVDPNGSGKTYVVTTGTFADANVLGITQGTLTIPVGQTVTAKKFRVLNQDNTGHSATVNIAGELDVTANTSSANVWSKFDSEGGILFGHYHGTATYNITGSLIGRNSYMEVAYSAEKQTVDINGGLVAVKGIYAYYHNGDHEINLTNGGTLEVAEVPSGSAAIALKFGYGTYCQKSNGTVSHTMTFSGMKTEPTTLDPYGCQMTVNSMAGSGYITVADSSTGASGKVNFNGSAGTVIMTAANAANIGISSYSGTVLLTESASVSGATAFANGLTLKFDDIGMAVAPKKLTLGSTLTFASGTVDIAFGEDATPYDGATLIDWTANGAAPAGTFAFADSSLNSSWVLIKETTGLKIYSSVIKDAEAAPAGTVSVDGGSFKATVSPTGAAVTLGSYITKLEVSVTDNAFGTLTAPGVLPADVVVKYGDTVTTGAYLIGKVGDVITFALNPAGSVNGVSVTPELETSSPIAVGSGATTPTFAVKTIPGVWYAIKYSDTVDGTPIRGTPIQATGTSTYVGGALLPTSGAKYYKIVAGATSAME